MHVQYNELETQRTDPLSRKCVPEELSCSSMPRQAAGGGHKGLQGQASGCITKHPTASTRTPPTRPGISSHAGCPVVLSWWPSPSASLRRRFLPIKAYARQLLQAVDEPAFH